MRELLITGLYHDYQAHARWINLVLTTMSMAGMTANLLTRRNKASRRSRRIGLWLYFLLCNTVYGTALAIKQHFPYTNAVGVNTIIAIGLLGAILWHPDGDDRMPPHDRSVGTWFIDRLDTEVRAIRSRRFTRHNPKE